MKDLLVKQLELALKNKQFFFRKQILK